ncbi:SdpI family protein [Vallitalea okinawensis]|uniref:SdpI family protein n=1 Tax=Vallitalea okinawensis TaxID=2078660 RepID=UPI000CFBD963|nr:SdpI family protein [Vallitalea okinawensis]
MKLMKWVFIIAMISFIFNILLLPFLPEQIPMHWNIYGQVDRYDNKYFVLLLAGLPILMYGLGKVLPKIDPKRENYKKHAKSYHLIMTLIMLFFIYINWIVLASSLGYGVDTSIWVNFGIGVLFIIMGNYMPKIRHNYFVGVKTPWTIADEDTWNKTHRVAGYYFLIAGLLFIFGGFVNQPNFYFASTAYIIIGVVGLFIYSYIVFKKNTK